MTGRAEEPYADRFPCRDPTILSSASIHLLIGGQATAQDLPLMRQYERLKAEYPDALLLFRLGDFYETFGADAELAARELGIALTTRDRGKEHPMPLAGVPHHALDTYLARLIKNGHKVAICEQMGAPSKKGLVDRKIVRVVTPGSIIEEALLDGKLTNYLMALHIEKGVAGIALADTSTGELRVSEVPEKELDAEIARIRPSEILMADGERFSIPQSADSVISRYKSEAFDGTRSIEALRNQFPHMAERLAAPSPGLVAAGACLAYVSEMQKGPASQFTSLSFSDAGRRMTLDHVTLRNLEILENVRDRGEEHTLVSVLDYTSSKAGKRTLRRWLAEPLMDAREISERHDAVEELLARHDARADAQALAGGVRDIERLMSRASYGNASPRETGQLAESLESAGKLKASIEEWKPGAKLLAELAGEIDPCVDVSAEIRRTLVDEPPLATDSGGIVRPGFSPGLDALREARRSGKEWIARFEASERARTGIKSLKVGYTRVFGYYIEVSKTNLDKVPPEYGRKQTVATGERFTTPELKEQESLVMNAEERGLEMERQIFRELCASIGKHAARVQKTASAIGNLDALASFAEAAERNRYSRPKVDSGHEIRIVEGRHPVVEQALRERFVPNDAQLDGDRNRLIVITGPNMAGKSTYMRQVALIVAMAQAGSFVPAKFAKLGVVDRIFTRVGAYDDLARGQSTFMVEMLEVSSILKAATPRSLILLDEIGRGTSTYDGMSIAWAVAEYIHSRRVGAKALFATHYHDLTALADILQGVQNCHIAVKEEKDEIVFLRKVVPGSTNRSYGIQVAALAGMPPDVVARAKEVLKRLEEGAGSGKAPRAPKRVHTQLVLYEPMQKDDRVKAHLREIKLENMTPLEALNKLQELKRMAEEDGK
ncbi:MAG: DNA mismatch repair protein MutS [Euryarchaeota archaeon]|nr:DNA mismatch repair protein MutS [Euryarchaeota archaeon]